MNNEKYSGISIQTFRDMEFITKINYDVFMKKYKKYSKERTKIKNEWVNLLVSLYPKNILFPEWFKLIVLVLSGNNFDNNLYWIKMISNLLIVAQLMNCYHKL